MFDPLSARLANAPERGTGGSVAHTADPMREGRRARTSAALPGHLWSQGHAGVLGRACPPPCPPCTSRCRALSCSGRFEHLCWVRAPCPPGLPAEAPAGSLGGPVLGRALGGGGLQRGRAPAWVTVLESYRKHSFLVHFCDGRSCFFFLPFY